MAASSLCCLGRRLGSTGTLCISLVLLVAPTAATAVTPLYDAQWTISLGACGPSWGASVRGMCVGPDGTLYIPDTACPLIHRLASNGVQLPDIACPSGSVPYCVACDSHGNLFASCQDQSLLRFDANGAFLGEWQSPGTTCGTIYDVTVGPDDSIYLFFTTCPSPAVAVNYIARLAPDGSLLAQWTVPLGWPPGLTVDRKGQVYLLSFDDQAGNTTDFIYKYTSTGSSLGSWEVHEGGDALGITSDASGRIIVICGDWRSGIGPVGGNWRVDQFASDGTLKSSWTDANMAKATAIAITDACQLYLWSNHEQLVVARYTMDADGDGLCDNWETDGLQMPGTMANKLVGADPLHKDVFVAWDAMQGCGPPAGALDAVAAAFGAVPNALLNPPNPDTVHPDGINLHFEVGTESETQAAWSPPPDRQHMPPEFVAFKSTHFGGGDPGVQKAMALAYRYCAFAKSFSGTQTGFTAWPSGRPGPDCLVTVVALRAEDITPQSYSGVVMHELGHSLGLLHGGGDDVNNKPNYGSVMNYSHVMPLRYNSLDGTVNWTPFILDYSRSLFNTLDKNNLSEGAGIGGRPGMDVLAGPWNVPYGGIGGPLGPLPVHETGPADWNRNGRIDAGVIPPTNINWVSGSTPPPMSPPLAHYVDWPNLIYRVSASASAGQTPALVSHVASIQDAASGEFSQDDYDALTTAIRDCNNNRIPDNLDISDGTSLDVDCDGIPDECEAPRVAIGSQTAVMCPAGDGENVSVQVNLAGVCGINTGEQNLRVGLAIRGADPGVTLWTSAWKPLHNGDTLWTVYAPSFQKGLATISRASGCGMLRFDAVAGGKLIARGNGFWIRGYDQDVRVAGSVDQWDNDTWIQEKYNDAQNPGTGVPCGDFDRDGHVTAQNDFPMLATHHLHAIPWRLTVPNGGQVYDYWAAMPITWGRLYGDSAYATCWLLEDSAPGTRALIAANLPDTGLFIWNAQPLINGAGSDYRVLVEHTDGVRQDGGTNVQLASTSAGVITINAAQGGCPWVETMSPGFWQEENTILGRSLTGTLALDDYRLKTRPDTSGGEVRIRVRENETEYTTLDEARLIAVDHAPDVQAFGFQGNVVLGSRVAAARVTKSTGEDVTAQLTGGGSYVGQPGDTLIAQMFSSAPAGAARLEGGGGGDETDDGGGKSPQQSAYRLRSIGKGSVRSVDDFILGSTGILIQAPDGQGGWTTLEHYYPRERPDEAVIDTVGYDQLRYVFVGQHTLRFIGRIARSSETFTATKLPLLSALHSRLGDVSGAVSTLGNLTTDLQPGDTLSLGFQNVPLAVGQVRDLFLLTNGVYSSNLPSSQHPTGPVLPTQFALSQNQPNPFSSATTIRFALPRATQIRLEVFDSQGRRVRTLAQGDWAAGYQSIDWDKRNEAGSAVRPGVYLYRLTAGTYRAQKKMVLLP